MKILSRDNLAKRQAKSIKDSKAKKNLLLVLTGALIGFVNGLLGGGGGMICVPILQKKLNLAPKHAHATAIAVIFPLSFVSSVIYVFNGSIKSDLLLTIGLGVILGGIVGSLLLKFLPTKVVSIIFSILMIVAGVRLML